MAHRHGPARSDTVPAAGPVRTCIGCRRRAARDELVRVIAGTDPHGHPVVEPDPAHRAPGRGAHLHPTAECYRLAVRRKAFGRALRIPAGDAATGRGIDTSAVASHLGLDQRDQQ